MVVEVFKALPSASTSAIWIWIEAWSLAVMSRSVRQGIVGRVRTGWAFSKEGHDGVVRALTYWWPNTFGGRKGQRVLPVMNEASLVSVFVAKSDRQGDLGFDVGRRGMGVHGEG